MVVAYAWRATFDMDKPMKKLRLSSTASEIALAAVIALSPAVFSRSAQATTITTATQTINFGPGPTDFSNASQSFNLFDSTLGSLDSVVISGSYGFTSTVTVTNSAAGTSSGTVKAESAAGFGATAPSINTIIQTLLDTAGSATVGSGTINPAAFDLLGSTQGYSLAAGDAVNVFSNATVHTNGPVTDTAPADLAAFEAGGGGLSNLLFNTATGTDLSNTGGNTSAVQLTTGTGTVNIFYTYDAAPPTNTPEPASLALIGTGVLGIATIRRWRRKGSQSAGAEALMAAD